MSCPPFDDCKAMQSVVWNARSLIHIHTGITATPPTSSKNIVLAKSNAEEAVLELTDVLQSFVIKDTTTIPQTVGTGHGTCGKATFSIINSEEAVAALVDTLSDLNLEAEVGFTIVSKSKSKSRNRGRPVPVPAAAPSLYIDVEGVDLCRWGTISIIQLLVVPQNHVYLIDVHVLGDKAFTTCGCTYPQRTFKTILESTTIHKGIFDARNDSDALYNLFHVTLGGMHDIQVMEFATRIHTIDNYKSSRYVFGLNRCIEEDTDLTCFERESWLRSKDEGRRLFAPEKGGTYEVFNERPLSEAIRSYCVQDVQFLPKLWERYNAKMDAQRRAKVEEATAKRIALSRAKTYMGKGRHMAIGPW